MVKPWEQYSVGILEESFERSPLIEISHVAHFKHARRIFEDDTIRAQLVCDESKLNDRRVRVVWLSPNDWSGGFRYGNVRFKFRWEDIIQSAHFYWIEVMTDYRPHAPRLLVTEHEHELPRYEPETCQGPWQIIEGKHYWNGNYTLEILLERDLSLRDCSSIDSVRHHPQLCSIGARACKDRGVDQTEAARRLCAWLAATREHGLMQGQPDGSRAAKLVSTSAVRSAWNSSGIYSKVLNTYAMLDTIVGGAKTSSPLARACLYAIAMERDEDLRELLRYFDTQGEAIESVKSELLKTFPHAATAIENADSAQTPCRG